MTTIDWSHKFGLPTLNWISDSGQIDWLHAKSRQVTLVSTGQLTNRVALNAGYIRDIDDTQRIVDVVCIVDKSKARVAALKCMLHQVILSVAISTEWVKSLWKSMFYWNLHNYIESRARFPETTVINSITVAFRNHARFNVIMQVSVKHSFLQMLNSRWRASIIDYLHKRAFRTHKCHCSAPGNWTRAIGNVCAHRHCIRRQIDKGDICHR
jgi:hypothetical protein